MNIVPKKIAIYNDDVHLGQNLLVTPLVLKLTEVFPDIIIDVIAPLEIHYFWEHGYPVQVKQSADTCYDLVFATCKRESIRPKSKISTRILIAEKLKADYHYWKKSASFDMYYGLPDNRTSYLGKTYLDMLGLLDIETNHEINRPYFEVSDEYFEKVNLWLNKKGFKQSKYIFFNIHTTSNPTWTNNDDKFVQLACKVTQISNKPLLINNLLGSEERTNRFMHKAAFLKIPCATIPPISLHELAAIIKSSAFTITLDTAIHHLSRAVGGKTIVFTEKYPSFENWIENDQDTYTVAKENVAIEDVLTGIQLKQFYSI